MSEVNHRYNQRLDLQVPMDVFCNNQHLGRYQTRDINTDGAFIEVDTAKIPVNGVVEVAFAAPEVDTDVTRFKALVVRCADNGLGLWFTSYDPDFCQRMTAVLDQVGDAEGTQRQRILRGARI